MKKIIVRVLLTEYFLLNTIAIYAQESSAVSAAELAKKLSNPVASLISVPFQNNLDIGIGNHNGSRNTLNIQPVIPVSLSSEFNLVTRVILPVISQYDIYAENSHQYGLSDVLVSGFFSPAQAKNGITWGAGPALLIPTATDGLLGTKKFGIGPTVLVLKQTGGWTYGALVNQIWSVAGNKDRDDVNQMFIQPFLAYNFKSGAGLSVNAEMTQNWEAGNTTIYIDPVISAVIRLNKQTVSLAIGPRYNVAAPKGGKSDIGIRAAVTLVFPK